MLLEHSRKENGVFFAAKISDLSAGNTFYYLYLPTLIATLFSILWSCVDLDAKRGEPWYQLSKPSGTTGRGSLLLQYPFDFIASVPWQSIRSRYESYYQNLTYLFNLANSEIYQPLGSCPSVGFNRIDLLGTHSSPGRYFCGRHYHAYISDYYACVHRTCFRARSSQANNPQLHVFGVQYHES